MGRKKIVMLSKKDILAAHDIQKELVHVEPWSGDVWVYGMTGKERGEYEASIYEMQGKTQIMHLQNLKIKMCSLCMRDEDGRRMFDEDEIDDLGAKSSQAIEIIFDVAQRLSGLSTAEVENLSKNFVSEENGASGSASL
jgi:hypothetical protein